MADFGAIADAAARAVASMFIVLGVGVVFAYAGKVDTEGLRAIGVTINWIFVPAIMFDSFAAGLTLDALKTLWVVAIFGLLTAPISALFSYPAMLLSRPPGWFKDWFLFGVTFQNTVALPLVLIQTICSQVDVPVRNHDGTILKDSNGTTLWMTSQECITRGELYIFMYIFLHSLLFWVVAYDVMPKARQSKEVKHSNDELTDEEKGVTDNSSHHPQIRDQDDDQQLSSNDPEEGVDQLSKPGLENRPKSDEVDQAELNTMAAGLSESTNASSSTMPSATGQSSVEGVASTEIVDPVSIYMTGAVAATPRPIEKRLTKTLEQPDDYVAGSFYGGNQTMEAFRAAVGETTNAPKPPTCIGRIWAKTVWWFFHILSLCARPPIIAQLIGTLIGLVQPLQEAFYSPASVLRPVTLSIKIFAIASTAVTNLSMAAGLGLKLKESKMRHIFGGDPNGLSRRTVFGFVITRMFVIPAALFGLTYAIQVSKLIPSDRLLLLVLYMEALTPSANMCIVVPQILGNHQASGALSLLVLSQYILALPSMLLWVSISFYLTSDLL